MEEHPGGHMPRAASAPSLPSAGAKLGMALVLTTPRRRSQQQQQKPRRQRPQALQPLNSVQGVQALPDAGASGDRSVTPSTDQRPATASSGPRPQSKGKTVQKLRMGLAGGDYSDVVGGSDSDEEGMGSIRAEIVRLRKKLHKQACEFQSTKDQLVQVERELWQACADRDELRLKLSNLERIDRTKSSELLEERRKNDEMSKQVKEMSANLLSLTGNVEGGSGNQEGSGLRKRCFKLVQQNTTLQVQCRLLQRQKGWAEAKARVLQNEVTRVYLGVHDRVKDDTELENVMLKEVNVHQFPTDEARIYQPLMPNESVHQECVLDFLTHITHTHGMDIHGFLQSSRVFSEGIRNDCLSGLAREFYATWRRNAMLPHILRAVERIVHLSDYLAAFEAFSAEIANLLGCAHARIWIVDRFRQCMWSCVRDGDGQKTFTLKLPAAPPSKDLKGRETFHGRPSQKGVEEVGSGQGIAAAAYLTQRLVNVEDVRQDPRFSPEEETGADGHAKTMMCVPVCRMSKAGRQPQVRVVLQAVNKLQEPFFDPDRDGRILRLLGKVSMEVWQVCETSSASSMNTKRKDSLLQLFTEHMPCDTPQMLLTALERGLGETFLANSTALHVVQGQATVHVTINKHQNKLSQARCDGMKGIVGMVAKTMNQTTILASQVEGSRYDPVVDLIVSEKTVIHTVPICEGSGCVAVCQFACPEKEKSLVGDDGAYHPENTSHFRLLGLLLAFVQKHLHIVKNPPRLEASPTAASGPSPRTQDAAQSEGDENRGSKEGAGRKENRKETTRGRKPSAASSPLEAAAIKIQSAHRGRMTRMNMKVEHNEDGTVKGEPGGGGGTQSRVKMKRQTLPVDSRLNKTATIKSPRDRR